MKKKKIIEGRAAVLRLVTVLVMCSAMFLGCGNSNITSMRNEDKISVVCTIFPEYDWVREVVGELGEQYEITLLMDDGGDLHNYQPTALDIARIAQCDVFVYVGGESDGWVEDALKEATNPNMQVMNLLETLGTKVKEEELVEGMQVHDHDHEEEGVQEDGHDHDHEEGEVHEESEVEYDEHVWLSLKNTKSMVKAIEQALEAVDDANAAIYQKNADAYIQKLDDLDKEYEAAVTSAAKKTIVFGDRFPFRYLADDYGISYYAAFPGCSAETEASFETITFLAEKMDELELSKILVIENSDKKIAKTIIDNTATKNQEILVMNSLQSVTSKKIEEGVSYVSIMQENLEILKQAME